MKARSVREIVFSKDRGEPEIGQLKPTISESEDDENTMELRQEDLEDPKNRKVFLLESSLRELKQDNKLKDEKILWQSIELKFLRKALETMELGRCDISKVESLQEELTILKQKLKEGNTSFCNRLDAVGPLMSRSKEECVSEQRVMKDFRRVSLQAHEARSKNRPSPRNPNQVTRLILKNLPYSVKLADLTAFLSGHVKYVQWLHFEGRGRQFTGIAFVEMATCSCAADAVAMTGY
jgi:hypothetical protein